MRSGVVGEAAQVEIWVTLDDQGAQCGHLALSAPFAKKCMYMFIDR